MRAIAGRVLRRIGRRGAWLLFIALLAFAFASSLANASDAQRATFGRVVPLWVWAVLWAATGVVCVVQAFVRDDRLGFSAAEVMLLLWAGLSFQAWLIGAQPRGWLGGLIYLGFAGGLWLVGTWPEPLTVPAALDESWPDAVVTANARGEITGWQGAAARMFGWSAAEAAGMQLTTLMPGRYHARHRAAFARARDTGKLATLGQTLKVEARAKDGTEFPVAISLGAQEIGGDVKFSAVMRDLRRP